MNKRRLLGLALLGFLCSPGLAEGTIDSGALSGLGARHIGSAQMSGRVSCLACRTERDGKTSLFVGAASGGVWRSYNGGTTFQPVFDEQNCQSIGAIAIDPARPKTIWVGTGESWTRNSVSIGAGIFRSDDDGQSWKCMGLEKTERISKIVVDPLNSETIYACVPGPLWSDSPERGLYKSVNGGRSWRKILAGPNQSTGCSSLAMHPRDPKMMFASLWDFRRKGWEFRSGGNGPQAASGSALVQTRDGGQSWQPVLPGTRGLPPGPWGRVEIEYAPSDPTRVYAVIESTKSGLYISQDGGKTWEAGDRSHMMVWRPFYFSNLIVDPKNPLRLFKTDLRLIQSEDGGKSFSNSSGGSHCDWHDLWIDPRNTQHLIGGDDGGLWQSYDGGSTWNHHLNLPISQFYHVSVDDQDPYQVYGGLQDNSSWVGDSAYPGGISNSRWENLYGGDGFWTFPDPSDANYVYAEYQGGGLSRIHRKTLLGRDIQPRAGRDEKLRYNWNSPIHLSPDPQQKGTLYLGSQFLWKTADQGQTWERISPDLTTNDPERLRQEQSGGITVDNSAAEMHCTIYSISESPKAPGTIWVGTDDGNLQLTRDGGKTWTNLRDRLPGDPKQRWVSWVEASPHQPGSALLAVDSHTFGDMQAHLYATSDFGQTWTTLPTEGQVRGYAHVIKQDPVAPNLYYLGSEFGLWISTDAGQHWAQFKGGQLPCVAVRDLTFQGRDRDLVLATHGRGIWIVDDLTPLRQLAKTKPDKTAFLEGRPIQQRFVASGGWADGDGVYVGSNPEEGATLQYYQPKRHLFGPLRLEIVDSKGQVVANLNAPRRRGLNRVQWTMRLKPPEVPKAAQLAGASTSGPRVLPGTYTARLTKGQEVIEMPFTVALDRRATYSATDRAEQLAACQKVIGLFADMSELVANLNALQSQTRQRLAQTGDPKLVEFDRALEGLRIKLVATKEGGAITGEERLREHTDSLYGALLSYEGKPSSNHIQRIEVLRQELNAVASERDQLLRSSLPAINQLLEQRKQQPIVPDQKLTEVYESAKSGSHTQREPREHFAGQAL